MIFNLGGLFENTDSWALSLEILTQEIFKTLQAFAQAGFGKPYMETQRSGAHSFYKELDGLPKDGAFAVDLLEEFVALYFYIKYLNKRKSEKKQTKQ